jgi:hypothetical protein
LKKNQFKKLKLRRALNVNNKEARESGRKTFHPKNIN